MDVKSMCQGRQSVDNFNYGVENNNIGGGLGDISDLQIKTESVDGINLNQGNVQSGYTQNEKQIGEKEVKESVDKLNKLFEGKDTHVEYEFVGKSRQISIKIINDNTKEILKEIPPKKIVEMIDKLCELAGIMVDEKA